MEPAVWGKYMWTTLHLIALGYPDEPNTTDKENYRDFYLNFWRVLPCHKCSINYRRHLKELPIHDYLNNSTSLFEWTVLLHNIVNKELKKREISFDEAYHKYRKLAQNKGDNTVFATLDSGWDKLIQKCVTVVLVGLLFIGGYHFLRR